MQVITVYEPVKPKVEKFVIELTAIEGKYLTNALAHAIDYLRDSGYQSIPNQLDELNKPLAVAVRPK